MCYFSRILISILAFSLLSFSKPGFSESSDPGLAERRIQYETYLENHVDDLSTLLQLAALEGEAGNTEVMLNHLNAAMAAHPEAIEPRLVLGRYYLLNKNPGMAEKVLAEVGDSAKSNPMALSVLAAAQFQNANFPGARDSLEALAVFEPDKASVFYMQARVYAELKDQAATVRALERSLELDPSQFPARLALARLLLLQGRDEAAREQVDILQAQAAEHPDVIRLVAELDDSDRTAD